MQLAMSDFRMVRCMNHDSLGKKRPPAMLKWLHGSCNDIRQLVMLIAMKFPGKACLLVCKTVWKAAHDYTGERACCFGC